MAFSADDIATLTEPEFFSRWETWCERYASWVIDRFDADARRHMAKALQSRCKTLADVTSPRGPGAFLYLDDEAVPYDEKAVAKFLRKGEPNGFERLRQIRELLERATDFSPEGLEGEVQKFCEHHTVGMGKIAQPLRVAVTGSSASPPLGDTLALLGRDKVLTRIDRCLAELP